METRHGHLRAQDASGAEPRRAGLSAPVAIMVAVAFIIISALLACTAAEPRHLSPSSLPGPDGSTSETGQPAPGSPDGAVPAPPPRDIAPAPGTREPDTLPAAECPGDNERRSWYYTAASSAGRVPTVPDDASRLLGRYGGVWRVDTSAKVIYLTFDEGYEAGYTARILDVLRREGVPTAFFVTRSYIENNPDLVRRMAGEGHVVANHSDTHPSMPDIAFDEAAFEAELTRCAEAYRALTGERMAPLFRPPKGEYSARTLCMTQRLGYTTVMWSFAHRDWLTADQPPVATTVERVVRGAHPGAVLLLHAVSSSNTEALPEIIARLRADGYRFASLGDVVR